jgi:hypothetical protein
VTDATIIGAAFRRHKSTLRAFFDSCAIHWNHPLPALSYLVMRTAFKIEQ